MTTGSRPFHDVCFLNLMTPHGEREKRFYEAVLGWTWGAMQGVPGGSLVLVEGKTAGALMDMDLGQFPNERPNIGLLFKVQSADRTLAKVEELGGKKLMVMDVMENGRMGMAADPQGAVLGLWEPKKQDGIDCDSLAHGGPGWFEVFSNDAPASRAFYTKLFGWTFEESPLPGAEPYTVFMLDGRPCAGGMAIEHELKGMPPHWATTFTVRDVDAAVAKVRELGGKVHMEPMAIPNVGRFAPVASPAGVNFGVLQWG